MPSIDNTDMEQHQLQGSSFGYSATRMKTLENAASEFTLATLIVDKSGSVMGFSTEMESCIKEVIGACKKSPRADNLLVRLLAFNGMLEEVHGYKLLSECNLGDYDGCLNCYGVTALFDAMETGIRASVSFAETLGARDMDVNGIVVGITDGIDNDSSFTPANVGAALKDAVQSETLESLVSILVGVNTKADPRIPASLKAFKDEAGIGQYEDIDQADAGSLAKLADFVSKSISAQSQSLGSGGASKPISLTI